MAVPSVAAPTSTVGPTDTPVPTPTIDVNWVQYIADATWSPDGKSLAAYYDDVLRLWDLSIGQAREITRWSPSNPYFTAYTSPKELGWSSDGHMLVLNVPGNLQHRASLQLVDAETGMSVRALQDDVSYFEWSPNGQMLLLRVGNGPGIEVWGPGANSTK